MISEIADFGRHAAGVRGYLRTPSTPAASLDQLRKGLREREGRFLDTVARAVFAQPQSPYLRLFEHAGIEQGDLVRLVTDAGVDDALDRLYDAGVRVTIGEFRGLVPIERPGLSLSVSDSDFDNPLTQGAWRVTTGGSRSLGRQVLVNFAHLERQALYFELFAFAHEAGARPEAQWRPITMRIAANEALRSSRARKPLERWFSQTRLLERPFRARDTALSGNALLASRLFASAIPFPTYAPASDPRRVVDWLADMARAGNPALVGTSVGSAVRVCLAAEQLGADISGTLFRVGGEPLTAARVEAVARTGSMIFADYAMAELGRAGSACARPLASDDVHLLVDKIAIVQRSRVVPTTGDSVAALHFTTLLPSAPKLMINVETDDYATATTRDCGCPAGALGYVRHLHGIRSYEKLTSEGVTMRGTDVLELLEVTLPTRFGGAATDYQLVEEVDHALPVLTLVVSPRVGAVDESAVVAEVIGALAQAGPRAEEVAQIWGGAGTLRVVRREPHATGAGKILPIHVLARQP